MKNSVPTRDRKGEAGFSLVELLASTILLIIGMLFFAGLFGSAMASFVKTERTRAGKAYADTGLGDISARVRRTPSTTPRTETANWPAPNVGFSTSANGSVTRTLASSGDAVYGWASQQVIAGPGYVEFSPSWGTGIYIFDANDYNKYRALVVGWGSWQAIYEDGGNPADTCCAGRIIPVFIQGYRYRIEFSDKTNYYQITGTTKQLIYQSTNAPLHFPVQVMFGIFRDQGASITNIQIHGVLSDPNYIPDGGSVTAGTTCAAPYCDYVWQAPRNGASKPPPTVLPPGQAAPSGSQLLFIRRYRVQTIDTTTGVRKITMTLAPSTTEQPFLTRETKVFANK